MSTKKYHPRKSIIPFSTEAQEKIFSSPSFRLELARESHYHFFHIYFSNYITHPTADFQREIFQLTEDDSLQNLVIIAFRGSGKSTIVNLSYPLWSIIGKPQKKLILIVGLTQDQARRHLKNIKRELEGNPLLKKDIGPFTEEDELNNSSLYLAKYDAKIVAVSMDQSIRGIRHGQYRPDLIICDDIEDTGSVKTRESRDKTFHWLTSEVIAAGDQNTRLVMIGNLLHQDSALMRLKDKIRKREMKGKAKAYPIIKGKKILWPGKFSTTKSLKKEEKRIGDYITWMREYKLIIVPDDGQIVLPKDIHYYDELPQEHHSDDEKTGVYFQFFAIGTDLALSHKESADYTAFVPMKVFMVGNKPQIFVLPYLTNKRLDLPGTEETLKALAQAISDHPQSVSLYIENVGYQKAFGQVMRKDSYNAKDVLIQGDKRSRLSTAHYYIKTGRVLFPRKGCEQLIQQIMGFGVEKHDDLMDAFTLAVNEIMKQSNSASSYRDIKTGPMLTGNIWGMEF